MDEPFEEFQASKTKRLAATGRYLSTYFGKFRKRVTRVGKQVLVVGRELGAFTGRSEYPGMGLVIYI